MQHLSPNPHVVYKGANIIPLLFAFATGSFFWVLPIPDGVETKAWQLFSIFAGLIVGLIGKALPMGGISFLALTIATLTHTLTINEALSGFSYPVVWLIISAFFISRSVIKTGLGMRIAYNFVSLFGKRTLGLSYGISATELLLAPAMPSSTARGGGIIFPIVRSLAISFGSTPEKHSQRLIGSFLVLTAYYNNLITSAMFITAIAANPLVIAILQSENISISWGQWFIAASLPGILSLILVPYIVYKLYPPEIKYSPQAKRIAADFLEAMGPMSKYEWITLGAFVILIFLWTAGDKFFGLDGTVVALFGVSFLMTTGVLTWDDIKKEYEAWDTLCWFSTLITLATFLNKLGFITWISKYIQAAMTGFEWWQAWPLLTLLYFYSHYFFASNTPHVASMFAACLSVGLALSIPPYLLAFSLAFSSSLFACITHYGTGAAPIFFGSEYVNLKNWWRMGAIISVFFLLIWIGIGSLWWKLLGFW